MPFRIFRIRPVLGANVVGFLLGAVIFANFLVLTLYVQQVLGWSAVKTGVTFLATAGTVVIWAGVAQALTTSYGPRPVITMGMLILAAAMAWYTQLPVDGHFWPDLLRVVAVENVLGLGRHDLWAVNVEGDYHEEMGPASAEMPRVAFAGRAPGCT